MQDIMTTIYSRLPGPMQSVAASVRGLYLRHWRHGPGYEREVAEAIERDTWSPSRWTSWREEALATLLHRAATQVPWYREHWAQRRRRGDRASYELLEHWPVLEKDTVRADPLAFVADDVRPERLFHERTSGTTGTPIEVWRSRATITRLYALVEARTHRWCGVAPDAHYARLGGQLIVPVERTAPPFWVWNAPMHQLYLSTYHLSPEFLPHYIDALEQHDVRYVAGYTSAVTAIAHELLRQRRVLPMHAVFTNAEGVDDRQRDVISRAFQCHVHESYGQAEMVTGASECTAGGLHLWPETGVPEVWDGDAPAAAGTTGELIATGLLNPDMPLIRYRVGDRIRMHAGHEQCACGRGLPRIDKVEGRAQDLLRTPDGREVFWINPVFYGLPLRESQVIQERLDRVEVFVVPAEGFDPQVHPCTIAERMRYRMGGIDVVVRPVERIARTRNGKLRPVICRVAAPAGGIA